MSFDRIEESDVLKGLSDRRLAWPGPDQLRQPGGILHAKEFRRRRIDGSRLRSVGEGTLVLANLEPTFVPDA